LLAHNSGIKLDNLARGYAEKFPGSNIGFARYATQNFPDRDLAREYPATMVALTQTNPSAAEA
jgi:hypothetical protein